MDDSKKPNLTTNSNDPNATLPQSADLQQQTANPASATPQPAPDQPPAPPVAPINLPAQPTNQAAPIQQTSQTTETKPRNYALSRVIIATTMVLIVGGLATAGFLQSKSQSKTPAAVPVATEIVQKQIIVGTDPTFKPMEFMENNKMVGYDIDLANFLAKEMTTELTIKSIAFDNLFTTLERSEIDMIISGITISDERKLKYDFSEEYLNAGQVIITKKDDQVIKSTADLRGKKISVQKGTTNEEEAKKHTNAALVLPYENFEEATQSLVNGQSDAIFTDLPNAKVIIEENPTLKIASDPFTNEYYGIVLRKGDKRIKEVNDALQSLKVKGILDDLKQKWLD